MDRRLQPGYAASSQILRAAFLGPPAKQEAIASELRMPFGTYRHRLRRAVEDLAAELWARETVASSHRPSGSFRSTPPAGR
ncbi:MAG: hypothetical protein U0174_28350 [Polyangiaceae bacterium]